MPGTSDPRSSARTRRPAIATLAVLAAALGIPSAGQAAVTTFGSPLSVPATADTATGLNYQGSDVPTISNGQGVVVHVNHDGADTALWNTQIANGAPQVPASGQILTIKLEGCAQPARGGPAPLTQIHFQDFTPLGGGSAKVNVTSQPFDIPVCGNTASDGSPASGNTVTSYQPANLCASQGDYVAFNEEGGFDPTFYPSGVPYQVLGAVSGSSTDSFVRNNGTNNGATLSSGDTTNHDGFAHNPGKELMLQATVGTGLDGTALCAGGTLGGPPAPGSPNAPAPAPGHPGGPPAVTLHAQTDGVNHQRYVGLALYCAQRDRACAGTVSVLALGVTASRFAPFGTAALHAASQKTVHVRVRLSKQALKLIRSHHRRLSVTMLVKLNTGASFRQTVTLRV
jgi:hypothetical protein